MLSTATANRCTELGASIAELETRLAERLAPSARRPAESARFHEWDGQGSSWPSSVSCGSSKYPVGISASFLR